MIPLTFLAIAWIFHPSVVDFGQLFHFRHTNGRASSMACSGMAG